MRFGILNVNKPSGITSRQAVDVVKRIVRPDKCGHAGTLDPLASGVLVVCVGPATRLIPYVQQMRKEYRASFFLGQTSPTDDTDGEVTHLEGAPEPSLAQIEGLLRQFTGTIEQRPPAYSAVRVAGRRAYALARRGEQVELAPKSVHVYSIRIRRYEYPKLSLDIECGSGTYVRALGRDLANKLGTAAVMSSLERAAIGNYRVADAVSPEQITVETLFTHILSPITAVAHLPQLTLSAAELIEVGHGRPVVRNTTSTPSSDMEEWAALDPSNELAAIVRLKDAGEFWPVLNLSSSGT
jgi:tRNA pseudouridine55 synthase